MNRRDLLLLVGAAMTPSRPERPARVFRLGVLQVTPPGPGYLRSASGLSGTPLHRVSDGRGAGRAELFQQIPAVI